jgi:hypothetical protein
MTWTGDLLGKWGHTVCRLFIGPNGGQNCVLIPPDAFLPVTLSPIV